MRAVHLTVPALLLAAAAAFSLHRSSSVEPAAPPAGAPVEARPASPRSAEAKLESLRYALDYRDQVSIDSRAVAPTWVKGTWSTERLGEGRVKVELSDALLGGTEEAPNPGDVTAPFQLGAEDGGHFARLGFAAETPAKARALLTTIACALWFSPGEGDRWTVEEEDRTGRYLASYERRGDEVVRRRERYLAVRGPEGLDRRLARRYSATGTTRYRFDAAGLAEVVVDEHLGLAMGEGAPSIEVHVQATLRRMEIEPRLARAEALLPLEAPVGYGQRDAAAARQIEVKRLGDAALPELLAEVEQVRALPRGSKEEQAWRVDSFTKLRALLRVEPSAAAALGESLKSYAAEDPRMVSVMAGALGDAGTKEATEALSKLVSAELPDIARMHVVGALGLAAPSAESAATLTAALDDQAVGSMSALALGTQSGRLAGDDPSAARTAVQTLLDRYARAAGAGERLTYLQALANSGAPEALDVMRAALAGSDATLAAAAAYGLRFIRGPEADALLRGLLEGPTAEGILVQAIRAIAFRTPETWEAPLQRALERSTSSKAEQDAIRGVLAQWAS
jgi:hypothetical protein